MEALVVERAQTTMHFFLQSIKNGKQKIFFCNGFQSVLLFGSTQS